MLQFCETQTDKEHKTRWICSLHGSSYDIKWLWINSCEHQERNYSVFLLTSDIASEDYKTKRIKGTLWEYISKD